MSLLFRNYDTFSPKSCVLSFECLQFQPMTGAPSRLGPLGSVGRKSQTRTFKHGVNENHKCAFYSHWPVGLEGDYKIKVGHSCWLTNQRWCKIKYVNQEKHDWLFLFSEFPRPDKRERERRMMIKILETYERCTKIFWEGSLFWWCAKKFQKLRRLNPGDACPEPRRGITCIQGRPKSPYFRTIIRHGECRVRYLI